MKLFLCIFLTWASANGSADPDFLSYLLKRATNNVEKLCDGLTKEKIPESIASIDEVFFQLRTACGRIEFNVEKAAELRNVSQFDVNKNTVVFAYGWLADPNEDYVRDLAKVYNCRGGTNFVVLNTGSLLETFLWEYHVAAIRTEKIGEHVATGLKNLGIPAEKIHLIGHSLGAQVMGSAGRHFYNLTGEKVQRITGLDPARPCFLPPLSLPRLGKDDATFVDVIHSNPDSLGLLEPIGHVDFYPGGLVENQPGCVFGTCSHNRAIEYYLETVYPKNGNTFMGSQCSKFNDLISHTCSGLQSPMGYAADRSVRGIHYLPVNSLHTNAARSINSASCGLCRRQTRKGKKHSR